jgi:hypothetical protein
MPFKNRKQYKAFMKYLDEIRIETKHISEDLDEEGWDQLCAEEEIPCRYNILGESVS